jgi:hypothetical protein
VNIGDIKYYPDARPTHDSNIYVYLGHNELKQYEIFINIGEIKIIGFSVELDISRFGITFKFLTVKYETKHWMRGNR